MRQFNLINVIENLFNLLLQDKVLAYDDDEGKNSSGEHVLALTSDSLVLKSCIDNITYKEDCLDSQVRRFRLL